MKQKIVNSFVDVDVFKCWFRQRFQGALYFVCLQGSLLANWSSLIFINNFQLFFINQLKKWTSSQKDSLCQKTSWLYNHFIWFYKLIGIVWHLKKKIQTSLCDIPSLHDVRTPNMEIVLHAGLPITVIENLKKCLRKLTLTKTSRIWLLFSCRKLK